MATGKRVGSRAVRPKRTLKSTLNPLANPLALGICAGITLCVVAWGYLVYAAIDFGTAARDEGSGSAWGLLALASLGAIACLFAGLMMVTWLLRVVGIISDSDSDGDTELPTPPRAPGGKRIAR